MAKRAKSANKANHSRQLFYLQNGIVMLPTLAEELSIKKRIAAIRAKDAVPGTTKKLQEAVANA